MRHRLLTLLLGIAVASRADAQGFLGRWEVRNAQGGITSLVLTDGGGGKLGGTFSGNGNSFEVTGSAAGEEASGSIAGRGMALFFQAHVKGNTLLLVVAEPGPGGVPNLSSAQQVILNRATDDAMAAAPAHPSAAATSPSARPSARPSAPPSAVAGDPGGATEMDRRMIQLLTANAWCAFGFSGSQSYSSSSGTTRTERVVLAPDGTAHSNQRSESANSGANGSVTSQNDGGSTGRWRFENGVLAFSVDGLAWQPAAFRMTFNSNGSPIPLVGGKEYMVCQ